MSMKEAYKKKLEAQFDEWKVEIDKLKAKANKAEADAQIKYHKQIENIRVKQEAVREKLVELKDSGDGAWEDLKAGLDNAMKNLGDAIKTATSRFK
ncbi:MAG: coiled coil domain-containing protein [Desulfobacterales bacterium]